MLASKAINHLEGGWPKEVDHTEAEQVIRYRRKVEKDEDYVRMVARLGGVAEALVKQNNAIFTAYGTPSDDETDPVLHMLHGMHNEIQGLQKRIGELESENSELAGTAKNWESK